MLPLLPRRTLALCLAAALLGGGLVGFAAATELDAPASRAVVAAAELARTPLPAGSDQRGRAGVESSALALAAALDAVPVRADGDDASRYCPAEGLSVRWNAPLPGEFQLGGHIDPVGPPPTSETAAVNGIVVCEGVSYAYMGFEARWDGVAWALAAVPALSDEHGLEGEHAEHSEHAPEPVARAPRTPAPGSSVPSRGFSVPPVRGIDPYAAYDPQRVCDPVGKPGTVALRDLLLRTYPGSRNLGVSRTCTARGTSEHKEGRAFDWGVNKAVAAERAAAESAIARLLATDAAGHRHALARRLGVMYLIWDRQIWSAYSADRGWRPYGGASPHTDHVHISLSWDGAMGRTSYWSGANASLLTADPELRLASGSGPVGGSSPATRLVPTSGPVPVRSRTERPAEVRASRDPGRRERAEHRERSRAQRRSELPAVVPAPLVPSSPSAAPAAVTAAPPVPARTTVPERTRAPKPERTRAPKAERVRVPKAERVRAPKAERTRAPKAERVRVPKAERTRAPKPERDRPSKADRGGRPKSGRD